MLRVIIFSSIMLPLSSLPFHHSYSCYLFFPFPIVSRPLPSSSLLLKPFFIPYHPFTFLSSYCLLVCFHFHLPTLSLVRIFLLVWSFNLSPSSVVPSCFLGTIFCFFLPLHLLPLYLIFSFSSSSSVPFAFCSHFFPTTHTSGRHHSSCFCQACVRSFSVSFRVHPHE